MPGDYPTEPPYENEGYPPDPVNYSSTDDIAPVGPVDLEQQDDYEPRERIDVIADTMVGSAVAYIGFECLALSVSLFDRVSETNEVIENSLNVFRGGAVGVGGMALMVAGGLIATRPRQAKNDDN